MWIKIGIIVLILKLEGESSNIFNTTTCFDGGKGAYSIDCKKNGSETSLDIIALRNVYYGTKLRGSICNQDACCLTNTTSDCIYRRNNKMEDIIKTCSGNTYCTSETNRQFNFASCQHPTYRYSLFTHFALLEYECINIQKLVDICDAGTTKRDSSLYLTSNTFHKNHQTVNTKCSCVVTTNCNSTIQILAVDVRLASDVQNSDCYEELIITDGNTTNIVTCQDSGLHSFQPLFISNSNIVHIDLNTRDKHIGKVWIQVQGTDDESEIEVRCGDNTQLPINGNHMCEKYEPTTELTESPSSSTSGSPTTTIAPSSMQTFRSPTTTICTDCDQNNQDKQSKLSAGIVGGVSAAVVIIIIVLVIILVLVFRSRKSENNGSNENIYNTCIIEEDNHYETRVSGQAAGVTNPAYYIGKEGQHSAEHPDDHPYDNNTNDNDMNTQDVDGYDNLPTKC